jgi:hypothetical protein
MTREDAEFAVKAANAHAALVETVKEISSIAHRAANGGYKGEGRTLGEQKRLMRHIRGSAQAALKLAGE